MNLTQWNACDNPHLLVQTVMDLSEKDEHLDRKFYLTACALCWHFVHRSTNPLSVGTIRCAERHADKQNVKGEMYQLSKDMREMSIRPRIGTIEDACHSLIAYKTHPTTKLQRVIPVFYPLYMPTGEQYRKDIQEGCDIIRSIFGTLYSPYMVYEGVLCQANKPFSSPTDRIVDGVLLESVPWITSDVLSLAEACYSERVVRDCKECRGTGKVRETQCKSCHGTGLTHDGRMLRDTLLILRDALVDAGCPEEIVIEEEKRTGMNCPVCDAGGFWRQGQEFDHMRKCTRKGCGQTWIPGEIVTAKKMYSNPLLVALEEDKPRYRGFWPIDCLLGV